MPGGGTKPGIMTGSAGARFLDITRLVARGGNGPLTGIDRVERAYLRELVQGTAQAYLLAKTTLGWLVMDKAGAKLALQWIDDVTLIPRAGRVARLLAASRETPALEAAMRKVARARFRHGALGAWLRQHGGPGATWFSVGHWNLSDDVLQQVRAAAIKTVVMIHDVIALDHPEWSGPGASARFAAGLVAAGRNADLILCPSEFTRRRVAQHLAKGPEMLVAPLGVELSQVAVPFRDPAPYFVAIGTIEPRKNYALLLGVWEELARALPQGTVPKLHLVGKRGWESRLFFDRLDRSKGVGGAIVEHNALPDGEVVGMLAGAKALLAPSRAEGFGLPVAEAALLGVPVIASDLAVTREILGGYPTYIHADDRSAWTAAIKLALSHATKVDPQPIGDWTAHFNLVFNHLR